jgi:hypothetical protein
MKTKSVVDPIYNKEYFRQMVTTKPAWTIRAILVLYERQTEDEKDAMSTMEENGAGFNGFDAEFLSSLAEQVLSGKFLSENQIKAAQKKIGKYSQQLLDIALSKKERPVA